MTNTFNAQALKDAVAGSTVAAFAARIGVSRQAVYDWINGKSQPTGDHLAAIVQITGWPVDRLYRQL